MAHDEGVAPDFPVSAPSGQRAASGGLQPGGVGREVSKKHERVDSPLDRAAAAVQVVQGRTTSPTVSAGGCAAMGVGCQVNPGTSNLAVQAAGCKKRFAILTSYAASPVFLAL